MRLVGPPLARAATVAVDEPWLHADVDESVLRVSVAPDAGAARTGSVRVTTPLGVHTLAVSTAARKSRGRPAAQASRRHDKPPATPAVHDDAATSAAPAAQVQERPAAASVTPHDRTASDPPSAPPGATVPVSGPAPADAAASTPSRTPVWVAAGFVLLLVGIAAACLNFVDWSGNISGGGAGSSRAFAIPALVLALLVAASVLQPALGSVALGGAAGGFVAYLAFGAFTLMSLLRYDTDAPLWQAIATASVVGVLLALVALLLRGDLSPMPHLTTPAHPAALVLLVLGLAALTVFPFTGKQDGSLTDATFWYLLLPAAAALVVGSAVLVRGAERLERVLEAAAYAFLAVSTFQAIAWLLRNGALDSLATLAVLGAALLAGAVAVNARARSAERRQAGP